MYFDDLVDLASSSSFIYSYSKYVILLKIGAAMIKYKEKMAKWINVLKFYITNYIILQFNILIDNFVLILILIF